MYSVINPCAVVFLGVGIDPCQYETQLGKDPRKVVRCWNPWVLHP